MTEQADIEIPPSWAWSTLGEITASAIDQGGPQGRAEFFYVDISSVDNQAKRIQEARTLRVAEAPSRARQRLKADDVLVSMTRPNLNAVARVPAELDGAIGSTGFHVLRSLGVDPRWIAYAVQTSEFVERMTALVQGALYPAVRPHDIRSYRVPIPPLTDQRRIVAALEEHLSDLDAAVAALERSRTNVERWTSSILVATAYGRLCNGQRVRAEEPRVAGRATLPEGWQWATVDTVGDVLLGRQRAPQYLTGKHSKPYLRVANVGDDVLDFSDLKEMDFDTTHSAKYALQPGDIVVSEGQSPELVGQSAIYRGGVPGLCFQKTLHRFRANPERVLPEFAQIVFRAFVRSGDFQRHASLTVNIAHLTLERFKAVPFPLPPLETQRTLVEEVERRLIVAKHTATEIDVQLARAARFRRAILKRAFEGKLVPQDPNDEPASVLLASLGEDPVTPPAHRARRSRTRTIARRGRD